MLFTFTVLGEWYLQIRAEVSALAVVWHSCEVGWARGDTSGGEGIRLSAGKFIVTEELWQCVRLQGSRLDKVWGSKWPILA